MVEVGGISDACLPAFEMIWLLSAFFVPVVGISIALNNYLLFCNPSYLGENGSGIFFPKVLNNFPKSEKTFLGPERLLMLKEFFPGNFLTSPVAWSKGQKKKADLMSAFGVCPFWSNHPLHLIGNPL